MRFSSNPFNYSLNVWITTVLVSPIFLFSYTALEDNREWSVQAALGMYFLAVVIGALLSIPNWLILLYTAKRAIKLESSERLQKVILALTSSVLTIILFALVAAKAAWWEQMQLCIPYVLTVAVSCLTFRLE